MESSTTVISLSERDLNEYDELLQAERYDQFPVHTLLGRTGSIVVVDDAGRVLYGKAHTDSMITPQSPIGKINRVAR